MLKASGSALSVSALFAERDARRRRDQSDAEQFQKRRDEELAAFKKRLDDFQLTQEIIEAGLSRIRRAFENGETELMITSFPSDFCSDDGRAISNADAPPINRLTKEELERQAEQPDWLMTLPAGVRLLYEFWKTDLRPGGFAFSARIINYPGGTPGDVGVFFSWPKSSLDS